MINGGADRSFSQGREILCREAGLSHGLYKGGDEECTASWFIEVCEVGVVADPDLFEELDNTFSSSELALLVSGMTCLADGQLL